MDLVDLHASIKEGKGKELNKKLRTEGLAPGVVYKKDEDTLALKIDRRLLSKALHTDAGENVIIKLYIDGVKKKKERTVIVKEIQKDPVKDDIPSEDSSLAKELATDVEKTKEDIRSTVAFLKDDLEKTMADLKSGAEFLKRDLERTMEDLNTEITLRSKEPRKKPKSK